MPKRQKLDPWTQLDALVKRGKALETAALKYVAPPNARSLLVALIQEITEVDNEVLRCGGPESAVAHAQLSSIKDRLEEVRQLQDIDENAMIDPLKHSYATLLLINRAVKVAWCNVVPRPAQSED